MRFRQESSVSPRLNEDGELCFPVDDHGEVKHRTPEELGIPRVAADARPGALVPWINRSVAIKVPRVREQPVASHEIEQREKLRRLESELREQTIQGETVRMSARVTMGAEMLSPESDSRKEEKAMVDKRRKVAISDEQIAAIKASPTASASDLAKTLGIEQHLVYYYRAKFKKEAGVQRVSVDPKQPGGVASVERALAKVDGRKGGGVRKAAAVDADAAPIVRLELTLTEADTLLRKFSDTQRAAFFAAGLRAALLA